MPFTFGEATKEDAPAMGYIWAISLVDEFTLLRYGKISFEDKVQNFTNYVLNQMEIPNAPFFVLRDDEKDGIIAAYTQWIFPEPDKEEGKERKPGEKIVTDGMEMSVEEFEAIEKEEDETERIKMVEKIMQREYHPDLNIPLLAEWNQFLEALHRDTLKGRKAYVCGILCTHPDYRRRGLASQLVRWPFERAEKEGALIYIDTFEGGAGEALYRKMGFKEHIKRAVPDLERFGGKGSSTNLSLVKFPTGQS